MTADTDLRELEWWQRDHGDSCGCMAQARADRHAADNWNEWDFAVLYGPLPASRRRGQKREMTDLDKLE